MSFNDQSNGFVWKRSTNSESEDVWDDRALIVAYDRAVKQVNQKIADKSHESNDKSVNNCVNEINNKNNSNSSTGNKSWTSGQYCRCVYSEDGIEYEAQIISTNPSTETCVVKYIGYGNEEQKSLKDLKPSLGKSSRKLQSQQFQEFNTSNSDTDYDTNCSTNKTSHEFNHNPNILNQKMDSPKTSWFIPSSSYSEPKHSAQPIVPPPLPFCADSNIPSDEESLASMLMSWYMSGYHTGYYRALKQFKHNCCNKCNK